MKRKDDMELFSYEYKGHEYFYRILDSNIEFKNEKYYFRITVSKGNEHGHYRLIMFSLPADEIDQAQRVIREKIEEAADMLEREGKSWGM